MSLITRLRPDRTRPCAPADTTDDGPRARRRRIARGVLTGVAALLVYVALGMPDHLGRLTVGQFVPRAFLRIPLEGLLGAAVIIAAPSRVRRPVAALLGAGLGVLTVLKLVNIGFLEVLARRFDPVLDWPLFGDGYNALVETSGRPAAIGAAVAAAVLAVGTVALLAAAAARLSRVLAGRTRPATQAVTILLVAWVACALTGVRVLPGVRVAADSTVAIAKRAALRVPAALRDRAAFSAEARVDAFRDVPGDQLLTALRGKDVVVGVVESYGRAALEDPQMAPVVGPALAADQQRLAAAGFGARSAFLTSSTYGGGSWLAHASFQSGLWIDNQQRYRQLVASDRLTLTKAFKRAGWRTVGVEPGNTHAWPEAGFYQYDEVYDSRNLGYRGPRFGWSRMPDQFTLAAFQRNVYARKHAPLMAEITLTSSHEPWTRIPQLVGWDAVGDGSGYAAMAAAQPETRSSLWQDQAKVRNRYATSITYAVGSLVDWARTYGNDNLVLVLFGDHQAAPVISGQGASHDVPVTIVTRDRAVLDRIAGWQWQAGLTPGPQAPVWKMSAFRDRFLTAYGSPGGRPVVEHPSAVAGRMVGPVHGS